VKVSAVPQIEGLTVQDFLSYAKTRPGVLKHLPDERDWVHTDKPWICNVLYSLDPDGIQRMITAAMEERKIKVELSRHLNVRMRPEFAQALAECKNFSSKCLMGFTFFRLKGEGGRSDEGLDQEKAHPARDGRSEGV
jgi:hypothetical protein